MRYELEASRTRRDASTVLVLTWLAAVLLPRAPTAFKQSPAMAPRRSARVAEAAERAAGAFAVLPHTLFLRILAALPVNTRGRAACVSPAWRAALAERSLWRTLDLQRENAEVPTTDVILRAAAARAGGQLEKLVLPEENDLTFEALLEVVAENAATLRVIDASQCDHCGCWMWRVRLFEQVLRVVPLLQTFTAGGLMAGFEACSALRNLPPFGPLRILAIDMVMETFDEDVGAADVLAWAAALATHTSLKRLTLKGPNVLTALSFDAIFDAVHSVGTPERLILLLANPAGSRPPPGCSTYCGGGDQ